MVITTQIRPCFRLVELLATADHIVDYSVGNIIAKLILLYNNFFVNESSFILLHVTVSYGFARNIVIQNLISLVVGPPVGNVLFGETILYTLDVTVV